MKVNVRMESKMGMDERFGLTIHIIQANLKQAKSMEKEHINGQTIQLSVAISKMV